MRALGFPEDMVWEEMGYVADDVRKRREYAAAHYDPYPEPDQITDKPRVGNVSITPNNAPKGDSATSITNG